jgi:hypothetical protein
MENLKEKPMGQAIRNYYPKAFTLHQDVMFRVDGPGQSLPGITPDIDLSREIMKKMMREPGLEQKAWKKILYELGVYGFDVDRIKEQMEFDGEPEDGDYINIIVPQKIDLRLDKGLNVGRCKGCGHLNYINHMLRNSQGLPVHSKCPTGKPSRYTQAPVFVPFPNDESQAARPSSADQLKVQTVLPLDVNCLHLKPGNVCNHPQSTDGKCVDDMDGQHSYMKLGPNYPLKGIKIVNWNCPKGLKDIRPRNMTPHRAGTGYFYQKKFADSGITRRLYTTVAWETGKESEAIQSINSEINEIKKTWFENELVDFGQTKFSRIVVLDIVYGIKVGGYYDHFLRGPGQNHVMGRMLDTQGFVITIKEGIHDVAAGLDQYEDDPNVTDAIEDKVRIITHTLKHAILNQIPTFTGMEETLFGGSFETLDEGKGAKIYLYDNEVGGHGGFGTLMANGSRFSKLIESVYKAIKCPIRNCKLGCKHCLFLRNCTLGNNKINRRMLLDSGILQRQM